MAGRGGKSNIVGEETGLRGRRSLQLLGAEVEALLLKSSGGNFAVALLNLDADGAAVE